jgi:hypothetical protein
MGVTRSFDLPGERKCETVPEWVKPAIRPAEDDGSVTNHRSGAAGLPRMASERGSSPSRASPSAALHGLGYDVGGAYTLVWDPGRERPEEEPLAETPADQGDEGGG